LFAFVGTAAIATGLLIYLSDKNWPYQFLRKLMTWVLKRFFDFRVSGLENLPSSPKVILAANHSSFLDAVAVACAYPRKVYFMAAEFLFDRKFLGWVMQIGGCIPLKRGGFNKEAVKEALRILQFGHPLGIFPEGRITEDGKMIPARKGIGLIAKMAHAKIIPTAIEGTFEAWPKQEKFPKRFPIEVRFGKPVAESEFESPEELTREVMAEIADVKKQMEREGYLRVEPAEIIRHLINFGQR